MIFVRWGFSEGLRSLYIRFFCDYVDIFYRFDDGVGFFVWTDGKFFWGEEKGGGLVFKRVLFGVRRVGEIVFVLGV